MYPKDLVTQVSKLHYQRTLTYLIMNEKMKLKGQ